MKIRSGFVSNSSSSSFMGGIGVVVDFEKFNKWIEKMENLGVTSRDICTINPKNASDRDYSFQDEGNRWSILMPVNSEPSISVNKSDVDKINNNKDVQDQAKDALLDRQDNNIVYFIIGNDEGDSMFSDDGYDLDYDIDLDFFSDEQQTLYNEFGSEDSGISYADKTFGAGRNG